MKLLKLMFILTAIWFVLCQLVVLLNPMQPVNSVLRGFSTSCTDRDTLCWYGIVPGKTTFAEAAVLLRQYGFDFGSDLRTSRHLVAENCNVFFIPASSGDVISNLTFTDCTGIQWGDMMRQFGAPDMILICHDFTIPKPFYSYITGLNVRIDDAASGHYWATLQDHVSGFEMFWSLSVYPVGFVAPNPWMGFMPIWKYSRRNPIYDQYCYGEG